jgi:hypothetical protein
MGWAHLHQYFIFHDYHSADIAIGALPRFTEKPLQFLAKAAFSPRQLTNALGRSTGWPEAAVSAIF